MLTPSRERERPGIASYLITFTCYGSHLHGEEGRVDREHNTLGTRTLPEDRVRLGQSLGLMIDPPYHLDALRRSVVLEGLQEACRRRGWRLVAAHVRSNHVHVVIQAECSPERVMIGLKAYATRELNERGIEDRSQTRWARHGSTRYLWTREGVDEAIRYVVCGQGEEMAVYCCAS